jgi:hypothetical protein
MSSDQHGKLKEQSVKINTFAMSSGEGKLGK